jgi:hypothetical protein
MAALSAGGLGACERAEPNLTESVAVSDLHRYLEKSVAAKTGPDGRFALAAPHSPDGTPIITPERAGQLAKSFLLSYGRFMGDVWAGQRGAPVYWDQLEMDPRILFAESPYQRFPYTYHPADRRHFGPWYLVHFGSGGAPVLTVAVSALSTDLQIARDGRVLEPFLGGEYFKTAAVSLDPSVGPTQYAPVTPEEAAAHVASRTGAMVAEVPRLVLRDDHWHPVLAQWRVVLDRPVHLRRKEGGERVAAREVYVSSKRRVAVAQAAQPAGKRVHYTSGPSRGRDEPPQAELHLPRRPDVPTEYDVVSLEPQE